MLGELSRSSGARRAHAGIATLKRAAITNTILQEEMGGRRRLVLRELRDVIERRDNNAGRNQANYSLARISYSSTSTSSRKRRVSHSTAQRLGTEVFQNS